MACVNGEKRESTVWFLFHIMFDVECYKYRKNIFKHTISVQENDVSNLSFNHDNIKDSPAFTKNVRRSVVVTVGWCYSEPA